MMDGSRQFGHHVMFHILLPEEFILKKISEGMIREKVVQEYGMVCIDIAGMSKEEIRKELQYLIPE